MKRSEFHVCTTAVYPIDGEMSCMFGPVNFINTFWAINRDNWCVQANKRKGVAQPQLNPHHIHLSTPTLPRTQPLRTYSQLKHAHMPHSSGSPDHKNKSTSSLNMHSTHAHSVHGRMFSHLQIQSTPSTHIPLIEGCTYAPTQTVEVAAAIPIPSRVNLWFCARPSRFYEYYLEP